MDSGRWNEWNGLKWDVNNPVWSKGNQIKHEQWNR